MTSKKTKKIIAGVLLATFCVGIFSFYSKYYFLHLIYLLLGIYGILGYWMFIVEDEEWRI